MARPASSPSNDIIHPSVTQILRMSLSGAPRLLSVEMSPFFSIMSIDRLPKMLNEMIMMMNTNIRKMAAFSYFIIL